LISNTMDLSTLPRKIHVMRQLGVPYPPGYEQQATADLARQARQIAAGLGGPGGVDVKPDREIVAVIAYLQRLGTDIKAKDAPATAAGGGGR